MGDSSTQGVAYSYLRFSSKKQEQGDSLRRQTEAAAAWCKLNGVRLDTSTTLHDLGKSAFTGEHRKNPDRHALAAFLRLVEAGRIPRGSYLLVENLDRLTREHIRPAVTLFLSILEQGINIVTTASGKVFRHDSEEMTDVIIAVVELSRGHGESARKSELLSAAWGDKKRAAREGKPQPPKNNSTVAGKPFLSHRVPGWVEERGGRLVLIPQHAQTVKLIFDLARAGYGYTRLIQRLAAEKRPPMGRVPRWTRTTLARIVKGREARGEYQPHTRGDDGKRVADGPPIKDYYPPVVSEDEWQEAQGARGRKRGRISKHIDLFARLIVGARGEGSYFTTTRVCRSRNSRKHVRLLIPTDSNTGRVPCVSFPAVTFERAVLSCLKELDPHEILNGDAPPDESRVLSAELERLKASIAAIVAEMDLHGESDVLFKRLRTKEAEHRDIAARLAEAQQKAVYPLSSAWGEAQSLIGILDASTDPADTRQRLRNALARIVESIWLLVVPRGRVQLCAVQVWFAGGKRHRSYLILHRSARANKTTRHEGAWFVRSFADVAGPGDLDFRNRRHAADLDRVLLAVDLQRLDG